MKRFFIQAAFLFIGLLLGTSCEDEIDTAQPGSKWNTTYVTMHPKDYLSPLKAVSLSHSKKEGIKSNFEFQFIIKTSKPTMYDVTAEVEIEHDLPMSIEKMVLSDRYLTVKTGETQSEPVSLNISDWSELETIQDKQEYNLVVP